MKTNRKFIAVVKVVFNALYRLFDFLPRVEEVLFVSRQTDEPSSDFLACGKALDSRGLRAVYLTKKLKKSNVLPYAAHAVREIYHLARCRVCFVDRYDPMIGLIDFDCEHEQGETQGVLHVDYPVEPAIFQLWHAFGAFKKFGYQSADTVEGHTTDTLRSFGIHRNYSWVICSGEGCRAAFSEAFSYPMSRIVPLCRPEYRELLDIAARPENDEATSSRIKVLMAPTLRKNEGSQHPFRNLKTAVDASLIHEDLDFTWCFHPLEEGSGTGGQVPSNLLDADFVVTDYSSIAYEAYLLKKRVVFFTPDIDEYRVSPGLNADPGILCKDLTFTTTDDLLRSLETWAHDVGDYPHDQFDAFVSGSFTGAPYDPATAIADFVMVNYTHENLFR